MPFVCRSNDAAADDDDDDDDDDDYYNEREDERENMERRTKNPRELEAKDSGVLVVYNPRFLEESWLRTLNFAGAAFHLAEGTSRLLFCNSLVLFISVCVKYLLVRLLFILWDLDELQFVL